MKEPKQGILLNTYNCYLDVIYSSSRVEVSSRSEVILLVLLSL